MRPFSHRILLLPLVSMVLGAAEDKKGCSDHPLVTRMPGYVLVSCETKAFGTHRFNSRESGDLKYLNPEGKLTELKYGLAATAAGTHLSKITLIRNYQDALKAIGGRVIYDNPDGGISVIRLDKGTRETFVEVKHYTSTYTVVILERGSMEQEVKAVDISTALETQGRIALYGITFDFNKTELRPESEETMKTMAQILKDSPTLTVFIVGHTDSVGDHATNLKLSKARAEAVKAALATRFGSDPKRITADGVASMCPVATNGTEAGRALNRRVEMVKR